MAAIFDDQEILFGRMVQQGSGHFMVHSKRSTFECDLPSLEDYHAYLGDLVQCVRLFVHGAHNVMEIDLNINCDRCL